MVMLSFLPPLPIWLESLGDALLLVVLLSPVLYFGLYRILIQHIAHRQRVEGELAKHHDRLDNLVAARTAEISTINKQLKQEIAERKHAAQALHDSAETYQLLVENLQEGIWFIDKDARTTFVNPRMAEMLGYTVEEMQGKHLFSFMDERGVEISKRNLERRKQGIKEQHDFELLRKNGERVYTSMETAPITDDQGNYIGALASVADITERRQTEEELQKRTHELGERVKKLNCLYSLSHLVEDHGISLEEILQGTVDLIPSAWQYPEITCAGISLDDLEFKTENFKETRWKQTSKIMLKGESIGNLEINYLEERAKIDEGPFLKEERSLINEVASRLGRIIERLQAEEKLKREAKLTAALSELYEPLISPSASIEDIAYTVLEKAKSLTESEHGYVSSIDSATGAMDVHTHTAMLKNQCRVTGENRRLVFHPEKDGHYPSLWGHSLNTLEAFYTNSPPTHETSTGVPKGHIPIDRFLSTPVMLGKALVGQISVTNKAQDYTEKDLEAINRLAWFYALAIQRNRAEKALQDAKDELEKRVVERTKKLMLANMKLKKEIEERRFAEEKLLQSKSTLQAVVDGISEPLVLLDRNMSVRMLNRAAADYYGLAEYRDILDAKCHQMLRASAAPCNGCEVPAAISSGKSMVFERRGFMDNDRLEKVFLYPVNTRDGRSGDVLLRISDITEQRMFEKQIVQSEKMASLGVLVSSVAHEINNPINFISFNIPILRDYVQELLPIVDAYAGEHPAFEICHLPYRDFREDISKLLDNIEHGSGRITDFVSNLKDFSQVKDKVKEDWIDLNAVIGKVLSICRVQLKKSVKSLITKIPENPPRIWTDPNALEQILLNLLVNAAQASEKEGSRVELSLEIRDSWRDHTIFEVSDNGSGMDEKTLQKIFDPFFTTKSGAGGTGLGLYVCHSLAESLGGRIEVESQPGKGSTFRIILPDKDRRSEKRI